VNDRLAGQFRLCLGFSAIAALLSANGLVQLRCQLFSGFLWRSKWFVFPALKQLETKFACVMLRSGRLR
jgi:hypothetical protein